MPNDVPNERGYRILAHELRLASSPKRLGAFLHRLLAPFEAEVGPRARRYELRHEPGHERPWAMVVDGRVHQRRASSSGLLELALWEISRNAIASEHGFLAIHAAAASWRGGGILLPAPPDSGKSTLVAGLTRAGCSYLTDEAALIHPATAMLHPFPRSLWLERGSVDAVFGTEPPRLPRTVGGQFHVRPADLRPRALGRPCPVRVVVAPAYEAGGPTELQVIGRAEAVTILAGNAFYLERFGGAGIELLGRVVREASCYRIRIGSLDDAVRMILDVTATVVDSSA